MYGRGADTDSFLGEKGTCFSLAVGPKVWRRPECRMLEMPSMLKRWGYTCHPVTSQGHGHYPLHLPSHRFPSSSCLPPEAPIPCPHLPLSPCPPPPHLSKPMALCLIPSHLHITPSCVHYIPPSLIPCLMSPSPISHHPFPVTTSLFHVPASSSPALSRSLHPFIPRQIGRAHV